MSSESIKKAFFDDKSRWISGVIIALVLVVVTFSKSFLVVWVFFGLIYLRAIYESARLMDIEKNLNIYITPTILWCISALYSPLTDIVFLALVLLSLPIMFEVKDFRKISLLAIYPTIPFLCLLYIHKAYVDSEWIIFMLFLTVAATDMGAYFGGRCYGKRKLAKNISPNKSIEGALSGLVAGTFFGAMGATMFLHQKEAWIYAIVIAFTISITSIFGDLFESYLKRVSGKKDSGAILPGHGGVLDRIDGVLFGVVALYFCLKVIY